MTPIEQIIALGTWVCAALVLYVYAGYPLIIYALALLFGRRQQPRKESGETKELPHVSLLIAAHNEEAVIEERIRNALACDYPADKLEIVVASDGSSDATPWIVARYGRRGVRLLHIEQRRGKAATINAAMSELAGDVVVMSDANTVFDPAAVGMLVRWFAEPSVGVVCGRLLLTDAAGGRNADGIYWKYESFLKRCEGRLGALLGANGGIYAIRRRQFVAIPSRTLIDDFCIPLVAKLTSGCAIVYDCQARASEETAMSVGSDFRRRVRIGAGGFQAIAMLWRLLDPRLGWISLAFFSHKVLRWSCPFFLLGALAGSSLLARYSLYQGALLLQAAFYAMALTGALWPNRSKAPRALRVAQMFASMNIALLVGFLTWCRGIETPQWQPTLRSAAYRKAA